MTELVTHNFRFPDQGIGVYLYILIILLSAALLIFWKKWKSKDCENHDFQLFKLGLDGQYRRINPKNGLTTYLLLDDNSKAKYNADYLLVVVMETELVDVEPNPRLVAVQFKVLMRFSESEF